MARRKNHVERGLEFITTFRNTDYQKVIIVADNFVDKKKNRLVIRSFRLFMVIYIKA